MSKFLSNIQSGVWVLLIIVLIGGLMPILTKIALRQTSPELFTFLRFLVSSIVLFPLFLKSKIKFDQNLLRLVFVSFFATGNVLLFAHGIKLTSASISQFLYLLVPIMVLILSRILLSERVGVKKLTGILIGFSGALILILLPLLERGSSISGNLLGNMFILLAVIFFSFYSVLSKKLHNLYTSLQLTMIFSLTTLLVMLIPSSAEIIKDVGLFSKLSVETWLSIFYVGAFGTAAYYLLYQYGIKHTSPTTASTITFYLQPIGVLIFAYFLLGEVLTVGFMIGAAVAAMGTFLVVKTR